MTSTSIAASTSQHYGRGAFGEGPSLRDPYYAEVTKLRTKIDELEAELRYVKELISPPGLIFPQRWRLTGKEEILLRALMATVSSTKERLLVALYETEPEVEIKIVDVFVCKLRKKLAKDGISIDTQWGCGYRIPPKMKALINSAAESTKRGDEWVPPLIGAPLAKQPAISAPRIGIIYTGADLREQRHDLGISQAEIARRIGAPHPGYISSVESGCGTSGWHKLMVKVLRDERRSRKLPDPPAMRP